MTNLNSILQTYASNPNSYLLAVKTNKNAALKDEDRDSLFLMEKGVWTWIKINVLSLFCLFNKTEIKFENVHNFFLFKIEKDNLKDVDVNIKNKFVEVFNEKIESWNYFHKPIVLSKL